jgi:hypothetical protein
VTSSLDKSQVAARIVDAGQIDNPAGIKAHKFLYGK